jgi:hypothetical protein
MERSESMGKKYIVEIGRLERLYKVSTSAKGMPNMTWLSPEVDLTPYTEPNLEQVRKEAYQKGYETGYKDGYNEPGKNQQEAYQRGLNDAREGKASCQFCEYEMCSDRADPCRICACNYMNFFEPKKQEEMDGLRQNIQTIVDQCGYTLDEIAKVLQKMKES